MFKRFWLEMWRKRAQKQIRETVNDKSLPELVASVTSVEEANAKLVVEWFEMQSRMRRRRMNSIGGGTFFFQPVQANTIVGPTYTGRPAPSFQPGRPCPKCKIMAADYSQKFCGNCGTSLLGEKTNGQTTELTELGERKLILKD